MKNHRQLKRVVADSSSLILLQKASLLQIFLECYHVVIPDAVYLEIIAGQKEGAFELAERLNTLVVSNTEKQIYQGMGRGECATINLYLEGIGDFVLLDDKRAAKYCKAEAIPFVNSLLISRMLYLSGCISKKEQTISKRLLLQNGYYSNTIISQAEALSDASLSAFLPV